MRDLKLEKLPSNVLDSKGEAPHSSGEYLFLCRLFGELEAELGESFYERTFVLHRWKYGEKGDSPIDLQKGGPGKILIVICDEREVFPLHRFSDYDLVFRAYGEPQDGDKWHPFPIGYFEMVGRESVMPFEERRNRIFFSGYLNRNRIDVYKQFNPICWLPKRNIPGRHLRELARRIIEKYYRKRDFSGLIPNSIIQFTEWFGKGYPPDQYARILADTQIAICPPGFIGNETIRHWEAMRMGCVIISAPLPSISFYEGSPIIQLDDWSKLRDTLDYLLNNPAKLMEIHYAMRKWWNDVVSERAIAKYMACIIRSRS